MAADDLSAPLGQNGGKKKRLTVPILLPRIVAGALAAFIAVFVLWIAFASDPFGGEPVVTVATVPQKSSDAAPTPTRPGPDAKGPTIAAPTQPSGQQQTVTIIDGVTGKKQEVLIGTSPAEPTKTPNLDARLAENTRHGVIPRIGTDGARPADVYARDSKVPPEKANAPRIAIVVGGLGIGVASTSDALAKLPGPVTLAFMPYGNDLERLVTRARSDGHEVLLQVPMEPFDYPDNDPGPQTLLSSLPTDQNLDRLYWFMSRVQGYVGIENYSGARFASTELAFAPVLREIGKRGLVYFDDASAPRSFASQIAGSSNLSFAKADVVIDATTTPTEIDRALGRLEAMARERGLAVGTASALPVSVERISQWVKTIEARGFLLVPITKAVTKPRST
jgi:polysaccharide deacetylase 2 family uncharacterized protein YibQ